MKIKNENFLNACKKNNFSKDQILDHLFSAVNLFLMNISDMKEILKCIDEKEYSDLDYKPSYMIRNGGTSNLVEYNFNNNSYTKNVIHNFDLDYFVYLKEKSKFSSEYTYKMMDYIKQVGINQLKYYTMGFIKISNIKKKDRNNKWLYVEEYIDNYKIKTIRDLYKVALKNTYDLKLKHEASEVLFWCRDFCFKSLNIDFFAEEKKLNLVNIERNFTNFLEELLMFFDFKTANSIKIVFRIYDEKWISVDQFNLSDTNLTKIITKYSDTFFKKHLYSLITYYNENKNVLEKMNNGYSALFDLFSKGELYE